MHVFLRGEREKSVNDFLLGTKGMHIAKATPASEARQDHISQTVYSGKPDIS